MAGAVAAVTVLTSSGRDIPPTRARVYTEQSACMLTGSLGLADPQAAQVWAGMQDASAITHATMSYLAVTGPATTGNALTYAITLAQRHCGTVVAVGKSQVEAVQNIAQNYPEAHIAVIAEKSSLSSVTAIPEGTAGNLRSAVATAVQRFSSS